MIATRLICKHKIWNWNAANNVFNNKFTWMYLQCLYIYFNTQLYGVQLQNIKMNILCKSYVCIYIHTLVLWSVKVCVYLCININSRIWTWYKHEQSTCRIISSRTLYLWDHQDTQVLVLENRYALYRHLCNTSKSSISVISSIGSLQIYTWHLITILVNRLII